MAQLTVPNVFTVFCLESRAMTIQLSRTTRTAMPLYHHPPVVTGYRRFSDERCELARLAGHVARAAGTFRTVTRVVENALAANDARRSRTS